MSFPKVLFGILLVVVSLSVGVKGLTDEDEQTIQDLELRNTDNLFVSFEVHPSEGFVGDDFYFELEVYPASNTSLRPWIVDVGAHQNDLFYGDINTYETIAYDYIEYDYAGEYLITGVVEANGRLYLFQEKVLVKDHYYHDNPHIYHDCAAERAIYLTLNIGQRWFYITIVVVLIIIFIALILAAWLLNSAACICRCICCGN